MQTSNLKSSFENLKGFNNKSKLRQAVRMMISSQYGSNAERQKLTEAFQDLDVNKDGHLTRDELLSGWLAAFGSAISDEEID
jgi:Ca2+-binding EF-hand superfamily protein